MRFYVVQKYMVNSKDPMLLISGGFFILGIWMFMDLTKDLLDPLNIISLIFLVGGGGTALFRYIQLKKLEKKGQE